MWGGCVEHCLCAFCAHVCAWGRDRERERERERERAPKAISKAQEIALG